MTKTERVVGGFGVAGIAAGVVMFVWTCGQMADAPKQRDEPADDRDDARDSVRAHLCRSSVDEEIALLVSRVDGHTAYVDPQVWQTLNLEQRTDVAEWVGVCKSDDGRAIIVDRNTGKTEALWGLRAGYMPE